MGELKTALVTGADRGFGLMIAERLLKEGFRVFAGKFIESYTLLEDLQKQYPELYIVQMNVQDPAHMKAAAAEIEKVSGKLDLLVSNAAIMGNYAETPTDVINGMRHIDSDMMTTFFMTNSFAAPLLVDTFLPLLEKGDMKRLFFTSSEISSVRLMRREGSMRYAMSKAALNLGVRMIYNELRPEGFTFRLYQPGWMMRQNPDGSIDHSHAIVEPDDSAKEAVRQMLEDRLDEDRLVLTDYLGRELSF